MYLQFAPFKAITVLEPAGNKVVVVFFPIEGSYLTGISMISFYLHLPGWNLANIIKGQKSHHLFIVCVRNVLVLESSSLNIMQNFFAS